MKYSQEFKSNAIKMVMEQGLTQTEVARRLEIKSQNINRWLKETQEPQPCSEAQNEDNTLLNNKIKELEKENRRLQMERDILKKATAFFAKESL